MHFITWNYDKLLATWNAGQDHKVTELAWRVHQWQASWSGYAVTSWSGSTMSLKLDYTRFNMVRVKIDSLILEIFLHFVFWNMNDPDLGDIPTLWMILILEIFLHFVFWNMNDPDLGDITTFCILKYEWSWSWRYYYILYFEIWMTVSRIRT